MSKDEIKTTKVQLAKEINKALKKVNKDGTDGRLEVRIPRAYRPLGLTAADIGDTPMRHSHLNREYRFRILEKTPGGLKVRH